MIDDKFEFPFEHLSTEAWRSLVEKELKGKSFEDHLIWNVDQNIQIESWQNTLPDPLPELIPLSAPCLNIGYIPHQDANEANAAAHEALMNGAEGIWFTKPYQGAALEVATRKIDSAIAPIFIKNSNLFDPVAAFLKSGNDDFTIGNETVLVNGARYRERGATAIEEIGFTICQALDIQRKRHSGQHLQFITGIGNSYLLEIAKIRALRWIWTKILSHEGLSAENPDLLGVNLSLYWTTNDPYTNVLRSTAAAMAGMLGGAQKIMIRPWDVSAPGLKTSNRISRNIQNLLKHEGRLDKNLNAADGAYFIEHLTVAIAEKAWELIQEIESARGFISFAKEGKLKQKLMRSQRELLSHHLEGKSKLLGVNMFPAKELKPEGIRPNSTYSLLPDVVQLAHQTQLAQG